MNLYNFSNLEPFNLNKEKKEFFFKDRINQLTVFHSKRSYLYKRFLKKFNYQLNKINSLDQVPFLPARTFKEIEYESGYHKIDWDGYDEYGNEIANGVYLYRIKAITNNSTRTYIGRCAKFN